MMVAVLLGFVVLTARRGRFNRGVFDAAQFALSAGAGALVFHATGAAGWSPGERIGPAVAAGAAYMIVNVGLLSLAMSVADGHHPLEVWRERFRWLTPYYLVRRPAGPRPERLLREARPHGAPCLHAPAGGDDALGPPVRAPHPRLRRGGAGGERGAPGGERAARRAQRRPPGSVPVRRRPRRPRARPQPRSPGTPRRRSHGSPAPPPSSRSASAREGSPCTPAERGSAASTSPRRRASRASAGIGSATRSCRSSPPRSRAQASSRRSARGTSRPSARSRAAWRRRTTTPAGTPSASPTSPSRSPTASATAGAELDAIEIGALLHDIGKIGIPERILHKPGPLDDEEWKVMKEHPVISEYILSGGRSRPDRAAGRPLQPRADRRPGLSGRARRRPDPASCPDRARRRRLRRADQRPPLPFGADRVPAAMEELRATCRHPVLPDA